MAERGGFEPPVRFKPVRRFSKPFLSATQASLRNCCQTVECQNSIIRNLSPFSENASQKLQIIRKKSQIPRFFFWKTAFPVRKPGKKNNHRLHIRDRQSMFLQRFVHDKERCRSRKSRKDQTWKSLQSAAVFAAGEADERLRHSG